jgi:hypothetical protein
MPRTHRIAALALSLGIAGCGASPADRSSARREALSPSGTAPDIWLDAPPSASPAPPSRGAEPFAAALGKDFAEEVKLLFRVVTCAGDTPLPKDLDPRPIQAHCADLAPKIKVYRTTYVTRAKPFLTALEPAGLPTTVVYPFGGGDLVTALTTYPAAREITTISLELTGDPRRIRDLDRAALERSLKQLRGELSELLVMSDYSKSETLKRTQRGDIPGELAFFLVSLAVHGYEPVSLRYFTLAADGAIHYLSEAEIAALEDTAAKHRKASWMPPDFSEAFANAEIGFRASGSGPNEPVRIHRHIAVNLSDDHLASDGAWLRHLEKKGRVAAMTKAASYLLWSDAFSTIRGYLLGNMDFMVSDSTGIPPAFAAKAGFVQETYGSFTRSRMRASGEHNAAFHKLWQTRPRRELSFRYGYLDDAGAPHLLITRKPPLP